MADKWGTSEKARNVRRRIIPGETGKRAYTNAVLLDGDHEVSLLREDFDAGHPYPIANEIHPTHIDHLGNFLWDIPSNVDTRDTLDPLYLIKRSTNMEAIDCDACVRRHYSTRVQCSANSGTNFLASVADPVLPVDHYRLYELGPSRTQLKGTWCLEFLYAPPGSSSYSAVAVRV